MVVKFEVLTRKEIDKLVCDRIEQKLKFVYDDMMKLKNRFNELELLISANIKKKNKGMKLE